MRLFNGVPPEPEAQKYVLEQIQPRINRFVTEDLLGPNWRRQSQEQEFSEENEQHGQVLPDVDDGLSLFTAALLDDPRLAEREKQLLHAITATDTTEDAAAVLGIKSSTARSMLVRIRQKLTV